MSRFVVNFIIINTLVQGISIRYNMYKIKYIYKLPLKRAKKNQVNDSVDSFFWSFFGNCTLNPRVARETDIPEPITPVIDDNGRIIAIQ